MFNITPDISQQFAAFIGYVVIAIVIGLTFLLQFRKVVKDAKKLTVEVVTWFQVEFIDKRIDPIIRQQEQIINIQSQHANILEQHAQSLNDHANSIAILEGKVLGGKINIDTDKE